MYSNKEINYFIKEKYPDYIEKLSLIEMHIMDKINKFGNENNSWIYGSDVRVGTLGRILGTIITTKTSLILLLDFLKQDNWEDIYFNKILHKELQKKGKYYAYLQTLDTNYRFMFFIKAYSHFETTARIICKELKIKGKKNPIDLLLEKTDSLDEKFILFLHSIRNTIHNNGFYFPIGKKYSKKWTYRFNDKKIVFEEGKSITVDWYDSIAIVNKLIDLVLQIVGKLDKSDIIKDTTTK